MTSTIRHTLSHTTRACSQVDEGIEAMLCCWLQQLQEFGGPEVEKPDLLLLDVMMDTWSDGFEMARDIRKNPEYKDMPIIMLTGVEQRTGIGFKSSAGDPEWLPVDGFLDKPVEPHVLIAEVKKVLSDKP